MSQEQEIRYATPVTETLNRHVTVRFFTDDPVPDGMVRAILNAARRSPTSSNTQSYSMVVVRDPEVRKQLAVYAGNQKHIETCDVFVAFCADIRRLEIACAMHGVEMARSLETSLVATVDAALVGMSAQTAAESFGLGAVMIGAMRNYPREAAELLGLPAGVYIVYGMCLGWPDWDSVPPQKPRMAEDLIIHYERYDAGDPREQLRHYDRALAEHYEQLGRNQHVAAWTGVMARQLSQPRRPHLRKTLEAMGFSFD